MRVDFCKVSVGCFYYDPTGIIEKRTKSIYRDLCQALRIAIAGRTISPPIFEVMEILGKEECMKRLKPYL